jgi:hypothetical protein
MSNLARLKTQLAGDYSRIERLTEDSELNRNDMFTRNACLFDARNRAKVRGAAKVPQGASEKTANARRSDQRDTDPSFHLLRILDHVLVLSDNHVFRPQPKVMKLSSTSVSTKGGAAVPQVDQK